MNGTQKKERPHSPLPMVKKAWLFAFICASLLIGTGTSFASWWAQFGPSPPPNPWAAGRSLATQHGDTAASDTSVLPGPGTGPVAAQVVVLGAVCPSILIGSDNMPLAICTRLQDQNPVVFLLEPNTNAPLASRVIPRGDLFGGVYPFLDNRGRIVVVDGNEHLLRLEHRLNAAGAWEITVETDVDLTPAIASACGSETCAGGVVGIIPAYDGRIWFSTADAVVGTYHPLFGTVRARRLGTGERIANSIASAPAGVAVATDHALYLLDSGFFGVPNIQWRAEYDRGPARKPGQLSHGTGSTPTFFGPHTGTEYLAIVDNAAPAEHLLVYRTHGNGRQICNTELPLPVGLGSENSPIGSGRSVFVASTYGYPYPSSPPEPSVPATAPISGGMTRIDLNVSATRCEVVWTNQVRSAAVPKLSLPDELIYTMERETLAGPGVPSPADAFYYTVIDPETGATLTRQPASATLLGDPIQMAGSIAPGRVIYQGVVGGFLKISAP